MKSLRWVVMSAVTGVLSLAAAGDPFELSVEVELGQDLGQPLGSIFEARNDQGEVVLGAGFEDGHSTYIRDNNRQVVFYCKPAGKNVVVTPIGKPYGPQENAARLVADRSELVVLNRFGSALPLLTLGSDSEFEPYSPEWAGATEGFCGLQYVDNRPMVFSADRIAYDGKTIYQSELGSGMFYYSRGTLLLFHGQTKQLHAVDWKPDDAEPVRLEKGRTFDIDGVPFVFGTYGSELHVVTNVGNYYVYTGTVLRRIRATDGKSWQAYSMVRVYDDLLIGHYPTGSLYAYGAEGLRLFEPAIPVPPEVSANAREAQTLAIHGGYLYAGVWPWGELWRYDPDAKTWEFVKRVFEDPPLSLEDQEPYARIMTEKKVDVYNYWGQRITSLTNVGNSLYIATMNKQGTPFKPESHDFLTPEIVAQYGRVHRLDSNAQIAAPFDWKEKTTFRFLCTDEGLELYQDDRQIGSVACDTKAVGEALSIQKGKGIYGPFTGALR